MAFFPLVIILIARTVSVSLPALFLLGKLNVNNVLILAWAGLRGVISMALSLPDSQYKECILSGCYFSVLFSTIGQGLSINTMIAALERKALKRQAKRP